MLKEFKVPEISCDHCANTIKQTLIGVEGVEKIEVQIPDKNVLIEYNKDVDMKYIRSLLLDQGYTVESE